MAITVCKALAKRGIGIPEQIAVSGCDDIEEAEDFFPSITTARLPVIEMGMEAVEKIHRYYLGEKQPNTAYIKSKATIYRASCGCNKEWYRNISDRKRMKISSSDSLQNEIIRIAQMSTNLTGLATLEDAVDKISRYWFEYENLSHLYLCLREKWDCFFAVNNLDDMNDQYMIMEGGFQRKKSCRNIKFSKKKLIPRDLSENQAMIFYFALLHYREHFFGYIGFSFEEEATGMTTLQAWLNNVSSVLENVRMHVELNSLVNQLEEMSVHDELTGLYNRRILETLGRTILDRSRKNHTKLMIFIADMDKLKLINDKFGHEKGDTALKVVAEAFQEAANDNEICIRIGGDEFMAIGADYDELKTTQFINRFVETLNNFNKTNQYGFEVFISFGWNLIEPDEDMTIEKCLLAADYLMYKQKTNKDTNNIKANLLT